VSRSEATRGLWAALGACVFWGLFPLYWHQLREIPTAQILAHRIVWCTLLVTGYLSIRERQWLKDSLRKPRVPLLLAASALLITLNWGVYIWSVNNDHVVEASLGYFINPLINVLLGVVLFHERLNRAQRVAVTLAGIGVGYLTWQIGAPPWIALTLAVTFGCYGLIRKIVPVESIAGLGVEGVFLLLPAVAFLLWSAYSGTGKFGPTASYHSVLLMAAGPATALPLIWFAYGARRISYSLIGIIQYVSPTLQLLSGVLIFKEPFAKAQLLGYSMIWVALTIYAVDGVLGSRRRVSAAALGAPGRGAPTNSAL
jgi:chloramphenicol-sensitive protein RarD